MARGLPFQSTVEANGAGTKFVPVIEIGKVPVKPANTSFGDSSVAVGTGFVTWNGSVPEIPPPGEGFENETGNVPAAMKSGPGITAVAVVAFTTVVDRMMPFQRTVPPSTNLVPVRVSVIPADPRGRELADRDTSVGMGLFTVNAAVEENRAPC